VYLLRRKCALQAEIPVCCLSIRDDLDASAHIAAGTLILTSPCQRTLDAATFMLVPHTRRSNVHARTAHSTQQRSCSYRPARTTAHVCHPSLTREPEANMRTAYAPTRALAHVTQRSHARSRPLVHDVCGNKHSLLRTGACIRLHTCILVVVLWLHRCTHSVVCVRTHGCTRVCRFSGEVRERPTSS
jgi:hypothetical protein